MKSRLSIAKIFGRTRKSIFLIDSSVILDVLLNKPNNHTEWSIDTLSECSEYGILAINQIIYAEVANVFSTLLDLANSLAIYQKLSLPWEAGFIASKAFLAYKKNGGKRETLLPDFYIGAHALFERLPLVTRDKGYSKYFPGLKIISPYQK